MIAAMAMGDHERSARVAADRAVACAGLVRHRERPWPRAVWRPDTRTAARGSHPDGMSGSAQGQRGEGSNHGPR